MLPIQRGLLARDAEIRTDFYLCVGDAVGLKARGVSADQNEYDPLVELKTRTTVGAPYDKGEESRDFEKWMNVAEEWPKCSLASSSSTFTFSEDSGPQWSTNDLRKGLARCVLASSKAKEQLFDRGLLGDSHSKPLATVSVLKSRKLKKIQLDPSRNRKTRVERTEIKLQFWPHGKGLTDSKLSDQWISIAAEGKHPKHISKFMAGMFPQIQVLNSSENPDLYFGGYPGFIEHVMKQLELD